mgnify:CR=1 FL=1
MKILVVSDTHGSADGFRLVVEREQPDQVLHLGDIEGQKQLFEEIAGVPVYVVKGNCDSFFSELPEDFVLDVGRHRVFMAHGHRLDVHYNPEALVATAKTEGADVAIYGHTHVPDFIPSYKGVAVLNPGSLSRPRQMGGKHTYAIIDVDDAGELYIHIETLEDD